jgi:hypothetical protein
MTQRKELIEKIKARHAELSQQASQVQDPETLLPEVEQVIGEIRQAGRFVPSGSERDLLVSLTSYWATYVFQHSADGRYPNTELEPPVDAGPVRASRVSLLQSLLRQPLWWGGGLVFILVIVILLTVVALPDPTSLSSIEATQTQVAAESTRLALSIMQERLTATMLALSATPSPTLFVTNPPTPGSPTPTFTASPTVEPTDTFTPEPPVTPIPSEMVVSGISARVTNLRDGQQVRPEEQLVVAYSNLLPDWTIFVLLQPQSFTRDQVGPTFFPQPETYIVPADQTSGEWWVTIRFGEADDLATATSYNLTLAVATSAQARKELQAASQGLTTLPAGVLSISQGVTEVYYLLRSAYIPIQGVRLLYSAYVEELSNAEIAVAQPDGSDALFIPNPERIVSLQPSISPDGRQIAYIGHEQSKGETIFVLWVMNADGSNRRVLLKQSGAIESPAWAPDGRSVAFSALGLDNVWRLYQADLQSGEIVQVAKSDFSTRYPSWMPKGDALIFSSLVKDTATLGLQRMNLATGEITVLHDTDAEESQPVVSPDGRFVAYVAWPEDTATSNRDIYLLDLRSGEVRRLTTNPALEQFPAWHPDGSSIYFQSYRTGTFTIWAVNLDGSDERQVTTGPDHTAPDLGMMDAYFPISSP